MSELVPHSKKEKMFFGIPATETKDISRATQLAERSQGDVPKLGYSIAFELGYMLTREQTRGLIHHVASEGRLDEVAAAPSETNEIELLANKGLYTELKRLIIKQDYYIDFLENMEDGGEYILKGEEKETDQAGIEGRLSLIAKNIAAIRKDLVAARKTEEGQSAVTINLGTMVSSAVSRMNEVPDVKTIDMEASGHE